jgi:hypothetical protein
MIKAIALIEHEIAAFIAKDNGATVHFRYDLNNNNNVKAHTINNVNKEMFLLKEAEGDDVFESLNKILEYVKSLDGMSSFTVNWNKANSLSNIQTSYFYCHDVADVVDKFFSDKNTADYIVYEIKLNPVA